MSLFKKSPPDLGKIKPQPYESFEEAEQKREQDAVAVNPPLTETAASRAAREQAGINPATQLVGDVVSPPITACRKPATSPISSRCKGLSETFQRPFCCAIKIKCKIKYAAPFLGSADIKRGRVRAIALWLRRESPAR